MARDFVGEIFRRRPSRDVSDLSALRAHPWAIDQMSARQADAPPSKKKREGGAALLW